MTALLVLVALLALRFAAAALAYALGDRHQTFAWHRRIRRAKSEPVYMDRWQLLRSPWLVIYVNKINLPDADDYPHTHPYASSWSVKLWNTYVERVWYACQTPGRCSSTPPAAFHSLKRTPPRFSRVPKLHQIVELKDDRPCYTLFVAFGKRRPWGFVDPETGETVRLGGGDGATAQTSASARA